MYFQPTFQQKIIYYPFTHYPLQVHPLSIKKFTNYPLKPLPLLPVIKNGLTILFKKQNKGNEQLRIDGDFYPCVI
jgi:hypothetical protein